MAAQVHTVGASSTHSTIADALAVAVDGDMILLEPGTYTECLVVSKSVGIIGYDGSGTTIIDCAGSGSWAVDITGTGTLTVRMGGVTVTNDGLGGLQTRSHNLFTQDVVFDDLGGSGNGGAITSTGVPFA